MGVSFLISRESLAILARGPPLVDEQTRALAPFDMNQETRGFRTLR